MPHANVAGETEPCDPVGHHAWVGPVLLPRLRHDLGLDLLADLRLHHLGHIRDTHGAVRRGRGAGRGGGNWYDGRARLLGGERLGDREPDRLRLRGDGAGLRDGRVRLGLSDQLGGVGGRGEVALDQAVDEVDRDVGRERGGSVGRKRGP